jgi:CRP/FNR family transcriptional regulator, cyclic AMP receptor protein
VQLITEGEFGDTLYIVLEGRLRAFAAGSDGREITYGVYGPGEYVGEMGLDGGPRSAHVEVLEPALCAVVVRRTLEAFLAEQPQFAFELLAKVIRRARAATMGLKQIALNDVYGRLKLLLESIAEPPGGDPTNRPTNGGPNGNGPHAAPSHLEMSQQLGCSREMVSRIMKDLERGGYVELGRRRIVLRRALPAKW